MNKNKNLVKMNSGNSAKKQDTTAGVLSSPCTISEAVQIAQGVVEDALGDYHQRNGNMQVAMSIQIEILKEILYKAKITTEEEFKKIYLERVNEVNQERQKRFGNGESDTNNSDPKMEPSVGDLEIRVEE